MNYKKWDNLLVDEDDNEISEAGNAKLFRSRKLVADDVFENAGSSECYLKSIKLYHSILSEKNESSEEYTDLKTSCTLNMACCFAKLCKWDLAVKYVDNAILSNTLTQEQLLRAIYIKSFSLLQSKDAIGQAYESVEILFAIIENYKTPIDKVTMSDYISLRNDIHTSYLRNCNPRIGFQLLREGKYDQCIYWFALTIKSSKITFPTNFLFKTMVGKAVACTSLHQLNEAIRLYINSAELSVSTEQKVSALLKAGTLQYTLKQYKDASQIYRKVLLMLRAETHDGEEASLLLRAWYQQWMMTEEGQTVEWMDPLEIKQLLEVDANEDEKVYDESNQKLKKQQQQQQQQEIPIPTLTTPMTFTSTTSIAYLLAMGGLGTSLSALVDSSTTNGSNNSNSSSSSSDSCHQQYLEEALSSLQFAVVHWKEAISRLRCSGHKIGSHPLRRLHKHFLVFLKPLVMILVTMRRTSEAQELINFAITLLEEDGTWSSDTSHCQSYRLTMITSFKWYKARLIHEHPLIRKEEEKRIGKVRKEGKEDDYMLWKDVIAGYQHLGNTRCALNVAIEYTSLIMRRGDVDWECETLFLHVTPATWLFLSADIEDLDHMKEMWLLVHRLATECVAEILAEGKLVRQAVEQQGHEVVLGKVESKESQDEDKEYREALTSTITNSSPTLKSKDVIPVTLDISWSLSSTSRYDDNHHGEGYYLNLSLWAKVCASLCGMTLLEIINGLESCKSFIDPLLLLKGNNQHPESTTTTTSRNEVETIRSPSQSLPLKDVTRGGSISGTSHHSLQLLRIDISILLCQCYLTREDHPLDYALEDAQVAVGLISSLIEGGRDSGNTSNSNSCNSNSSSSSSSSHNISLTPLPPTVLIIMRRRKIWALIALCHCSTGNSEEAELALHNMETFEEEEVDINKINDLQKQFLKGNLIADKERIIKHITKLKEVKQCNVTIHHQSLHVHQPQNSWKQISIDWIVNLWEIILDWVMMKFNKLALLISGTFFVCYIMSHIVFYLLHFLKSSEG